MLCHQLKWRRAKCDDGSDRISVQFGSEGVVANGAGGLGFNGIPQYVAGVTQSCKTIGDPMFVTDFEDDLVLTLAEPPAPQVCNLFGCTDEDDLHRSYMQRLFACGRFLTLVVGLFSSCWLPLHCRRDC